MLQELQKIQHIFVSFFAHVKKIYWPCCGLVLAFEDTEPIPHPAHVIGSTFGIYQKNLSVQTGAN